MQARALSALVALAVLSCGSGRPDFDVPQDLPEGGDDASARAEGSSGIRILSDVTVPREAESRATSIAMRDASTRDVSAPGEALRDVTTDGPLAERLADSSERSDGEASNRASPDDASMMAAWDSGDAEVEADGHRDANRDPLDACGSVCAARADHLLLSEIVTRPAGAEMIEIVNPTPRPITLADYLLSDSHLYYKVASGDFTTSSGSDFAARFPEGFTIQPAQYLVIGLANASGGSSSFEAVYGKKPDFELRPTANGALDDPSVPNMMPAQAGSSVGATASLTDGGEPVVLFVYKSGAALVSDVDYVFFGVPSSSNPVVDKTGVVASGSPYADDTASPSQRLIAAPAEGGSIHRCIYAESDEKRVGGNGVSGHDETSEDVSQSFVVSNTPAERTPGAPPPGGLCGDR